MNELIRFQNVFGKLELMLNEQNTQNLITSRQVYSSLRMTEEKEIN